LYGSTKNAKQCSERPRKTKGTRIREKNVNRLERKSIDMRLEKQADVLLEEQQDMHVTVQRGFAASPDKNQVIGYRVWGLGYGKR
jgi:hypothetical protein